MMNNHMTETMPILHRVCVGQEKFDDIVVLNINHDVKNCYCFSSELKNMFGKVVHIGIPYASSTASAREPFKDGI